MIIYILRKEFITWLLTENVRNVEVTMFNYLTKEVSMVVFGY